MNIYVVTEGDAEEKIYKCWIPFVNPALSPVDRIDDVAYNHFYLISGRGYPQYFEIIKEAIEDINQFTMFDRLVISVDSEEMNKTDKYTEVMEFISNHQCRVEIRIIIQHFCFETWGLGNRRIMRINPQTPRLRKYKALYDVRSDDPELLPGNPDEELSRSQFALKYLRAAINDRYRNLTYTKRNPTTVRNIRYFEQVRNRLIQTGHIPSFNEFLTAFV